MGTMEMPVGQCGACRFIREDDRGRPLICAQAVRVAAPEDKPCTLGALSSRPAHTVRVSEGT